MNLLFDMGPPGGAIGAFAGLAFFLIAIAVAFIAFRLLKKTLKLAFRLIVVFVIVAIGFLGTVFWFMTLGSRGPVRPPVRQTVNSNTHNR